MKPNIATLARSILTSLPLDGRDPLDSREAITCLAELAGGDPVDAASRVRQAITDQVHGVHQIGWLVVEWVVTANLTVAAQLAPCAAHLELTGTWTRQDGSRYAKRNKDRYEVSADSVTLLWSRGFRRVDRVALAPGVDGAVQILLGRLCRDGDR